jgi:DNA segregation ATPase FtsK/SpoIIIE-like protein
MSRSFSQGGSAEESAILTVDGQQHRIDDLNDEVKKLVLAIRDCDQQIIQTKRRLNYLEIARRALFDDLKSRLSP